MASRLGNCGGCSVGDWHYVGDPGEPAFEDAWANVGGAWVPARFRTICGGFEIEMAVTGGLSGGTIWTMPTEIVALIDYELPGVGFGAGGTFQAFHVLTTGEVVDGA
jgi:hypothetical protein